MSESGDAVCVVLSDDEESLFENDDGTVRARALTVNDDDFADADENENNKDVAPNGVAPTIKLDDSDTTKSPNANAATAETNVILVNSTLDESLAAALASESTTTMARKRTKKAEPATTTKKSTRASTKNDDGKGESDDDSDDDDAADANESDDNGWQRKKPTKAKRASKKQVCFVRSLIFHARTRNSKSLNRLSVRSARCD